jgi:RNA polymerase sigma factor (sigma-70 family)
MSLRHQSSGWFDSKTHESPEFPGRMIFFYYFNRHSGKKPVFATLYLVSMFISYQKRVDKNTLWERYIKGDKAAFGDLYTYYHKSLTAYCMGRLKVLALAENAASDTLIKLLQYQTPETIENFENWLFTVAKNECNTVWAKAERRKKLMAENLQTLTEHIPEVDEQYSIENIDQIIRANLEDGDYQLWQLYQQGYDNAEIAEILSLNEKTVANRKSAARTKLKLILKKHYADPIPIAKDTPQLPDAS